MYSIYVDDSLVSFADIRTEKQFFIKAIHNAILDQHWGSTIKVQLDGEIVREYTCEHLSKEDQKKYLNELIVNSAIEGGITIEQATLILLSYAL